MNRYPSRHGRRDGFYSFISYSTRDSEVKIVKPFIDEYCYELKRRGIHYIPVFYDGFYMTNGPYPDEGLARSLRNAIYKSDFMTSFLSPGYMKSPWCAREWIEAEHKPCPILPICWKKIYRYRLYYSESEIRHSVEKRRGLDISNELKHNRHVALHKAVEGTLLFLRALRI